MPDYTYSPSQAKRLFGYGGTLSVNRGTFAAPAWEELGKVNGIDIEDTIDELNLARRQMMTIPRGWEMTIVAPERPASASMPEALTGSILAAAALLLSVLFALLSG